MEEQEYLYKEFSTIRKFGGIKEVPAFIVDNFSRAIELRDYQIEALENTITYFENENVLAKKRKHLLYHMATGSGKTIIMAGMMLYLYNKGYRRFVFFVNSSNIVSKTIDNFVNKNLKKYLFADKIEINGRQIEIKKVKNFQHINNDAINICFTTVQGLHLDLHKPKENSLCQDDFEQDKVVLISDEAHHINADTASGKKLSKEEQEDLKDNESWESSITNVFNANKDNVMLEFTATCDLRNENIKRKYIDKIIYDYPLSKFRESGYTKEFLNYQSNTDLFTRTLQALLISQYRMKLFQSNKVNIKPIVLLKSKQICDSIAFFDNFHENLAKLTEKELLEIKNNNKNNNLIAKMFDYFKKNNISLENLAMELKMDFAKEHCVLMNNKQSISDEMQQKINSLEDSNNPYRLIFTVDMLNEGWDVLNLFDIVRLYDTRQGGKGGKPSKYTIKEAQLIGRGARYCPFQFNDGQEKYKRKYDDDIENEFRICETMLYHSKQDSKYIDELRRALKETGFLPHKEPIEIVYELKDSFKNTSLYKNGCLFVNERVLKSKRNAQLSDALKLFGVESVAVEDKTANIISLFENETAPEANLKTQTVSKKLKELPYHIVYAAMRKFENLAFSNLKAKFPQLTSSKEFLTSDSFAGNMTINFKILPGHKLTNSNIFRACLLVMNELSAIIPKIDYLYEGTQKFKAVPIKEIIPEKRVKLINQDLMDKDGVGVSQNAPNVSPKYRMDLSGEDWYVYNDNFGTTEEKSFVKYFSTIVNKLKKKFSKVYLLRNEQAFGIYSFDDGEKFEPDYVLLLCQERSNKPLGYQIFIEPKGSHLLKTDAWKEEFLKQLHPKAVIDDKNYSIWGLPFYNEENTLKEFGDALGEFYK